MFPGSKVLLVIALFLLSFLIIRSPAYALEKEIQIKALVINGKNSEPLPNTDVVIKLYYINSERTLKETYYKKRLTTDAFGRISSPRFIVKVYPEQIYRLRMVISCANYVDTVFFKEFSLDQVGTSLNYTFAINPKKLPLTIKGKVIDATTDQPITNNQISVYLTKYDMASKTWKNTDKINKSTSYDRNYTLELPGVYAPCAFSNRYRFDIAVHHQEYEEVVTEKNFLYSGKSTPEMEFYDFTTLNLTTYMVWKKNIIPLTFYLSDYNGRPVEGQSTLIYTGSGTSVENTIQRVSDMKGGVSVAVPAEYLYCANRFMNITLMNKDSLRDEESSRSFTRLLNHKDQYKTVKSRIGDSVDIEIIVQPKNSFLSSWTVGSWWKVRYSNRKSKDKLLIFKVAARENIDGAEYFQVNMSSSEKPDEIIYKLYYLIPDYSLEFVVDVEDDQKYDFDRNVPVVFYEDYPLDFPVLGNSFTRGRYQLSDKTNSLSELNQLDEQRYFKSNSLIQTISSEFAAGANKISSTLDSTIDKVIYLTTIDWFPKRPWWTSYKKETINEATSEFTSQCQAVLVSYGYNQYTFFQLN